LFTFFSFFHSDPRPGTLLNGEKRRKEREEGFGRVCVKEKCAYVWPY